MSEDLNIEKPELKCNNCGWEGDSTELIRLTINDKDNDFNYCPDCQSDNIENYNL